MTDLVSLLFTLFIAMIPIDFKITNFSLFASKAPLQMKE